MKAKLLRILRREAERAITTDAIIDGCYLTAYVYKHGNGIARYEGHVCDKNIILKRAIDRKHTLQRHYILDKLQKLK